MFSDQVETTDTTKLDLSVSKYVVRWESAGGRSDGTLLKGSWDLVTRVINKVTILRTPIRVLVTLLTKSPDPPSMAHLKTPPDPLHGSNSELAAVDLPTARSSSDVSIPHVGPYLQSCFGAKSR